MRSAVATAFAVCVLLPLPAASQSITPDIDRTLWCASAFYWLAGSAEDSGETAEAERYDGWSKRLLEFAGPGLVASGFGNDEIEKIVVDYDEKVLAELSSGEEPSYDVVACPELVAGLG